jgi:hypothetical protein
VHRAGAVNEAAPGMMVGMLANHLVARAAPA